MSNKQNFQLNTFGSEAHWLQRQTKKMDSLQFRKPTFFYIITSILGELIILHLF